jgi:hypothetical protein
MTTTARILLQHKGKNTNKKSEMGRASSYLVLNRNYDPIIVMKVRSCLDSWAAI